LNGLGADLELLKAAALEAGQLALTFFRRNPSAWAKEGGSPVTEADMAVDVFLRTRLIAERPHYGWLSEETADDPIRRERGTIFVVDPIDGTRGFIQGDDRWCVSVAVVRERRPVVGVLYAPARDEFYSAALGEGAWAGGKRLSIPSGGELAGARIAGPRGWLKSPALGRTNADLQPHVPSLAYRFASVATHRFDAAFASPRSQDWDLAACDLLLHEAGGLLTDLEGAPPVYNREIPRHGVLAAGNSELQPKLLTALRTVARERAAAGLPA
jgi:myo-inositol-1(or 4)-monophosphatase